MKSELSYVNNISLGNRLTNPDSNVPTTSRNIKKSSITTDDDVDEFSADDIQKFADEIQNLLVITRGMVSRPQDIRRPPNTANLL